MQQDIEETSIAAFCSISMISYWFSIDFDDLLLTSMYFDVVVWLISAFEDVVVHALPRRPPEVERVLREEVLHQHREAELLLFKALMHLKASLNTKNKTAFSIKVNIGQYWIIHNMGVFFEGRLFHPR